MSRSQSTIDWTVAIFRPCLRRPVGNPPLPDQHRYPERLSVFRHDSWLAYFPKSSLTASFRSSAYLAPYRKVGTDTPKAFARLSSFAFSVAPPFSQISLNMSVFASRPYAVAAPIRSPAVDSVR